MAVNHNIRDLAKKSEAAIRSGTRDLHEQLGPELERDTPVSSGLLQSSWSEDFNPGEINGTWRNSQDYAGPVALGGNRHRRGLSAKEQSNAGFPQRAWEKVRETLATTFRSHFRDQGINLRRR